MEFFRQHLLETSGIENILEYMGVAAKVLDKSQAITLIVSTPINPIHSFLEELQAIGVPTNFVVYELIDRNSEDVLKNLVTAIFMSKLLSSAKLIKIILYVRCGTSVVFLDHFLEYFRYFLGDLRKYKASVGVLYKPWYVTGSGFHRPEPELACSEWIVDELKSQRAIYPELTDWLLTRDTKGAYTKVRVLRMAHYPYNDTAGNRLRKEPLNSTYIAQQISSYVEEELQYSTVNADDFRLNMFRGVEASYNKFVEFVHGRIGHLIRVVFDQVIPSDDPALELPVTVNRFHNLLNLLRTWSINATNLDLDELLERLRPFINSTSVLKTEFDSYTVLQTAYNRAHQTLKKVRLNFKFDNIHSEFDQFVGTQQLRRGHQLEEHVRTFHGHINILKEVQYQYLRDQETLFIPVNETCRQAISRDGLALEMNISSIIKSRVYIDVEEHLASRLVEFSEKMESSIGNNNRVMDALILITTMTDAMKPQAYDKFWRKDIANWSSAEGQQASQAWMAKFQDYQNMLTGLNDRDDIHQPYVRPYLVDRIEPDRAVPGTYQAKINALYEQFKQNISSMAVQTMTDNNKPVVDKVVRELGKVVFAEFRDRFLGENFLGSKDQTDQLKRHLERMQNTKRSFFDFLHVAKQFFGVHDIVMPSVQEDRLEELAKGYEHIRSVVKQEYFRMEDTSHTWGFNFVYVREVLHTSLASNATALGGNQMILWFPLVTIVLLIKKMLNRWF